MPHETAAISVQVLRTLYNRAPCHFMQSHMRKVYVCLAVTCHLHFWQNDRDLLYATAVTRGWNGYWNKSQHRKLTLEKKILHRSCMDLNPQCSNRWATPTPDSFCNCCCVLPWPSPPERQWCRLGMLAPQWRAKHNLKENEAHRPV